MANLQQLIQLGVAGKLTPKEFSQLPPEIRQLLAQLMIQGQASQQKLSTRETKRNAYNAAKGAHVGWLAGELKAVGYLLIVLIPFAILFAAWLIIGTHATP